jgi:hypothetical protein
MEEYKEFSIKKSKLFQQTIGAVPNIGSNKFMVFKPCEVQDEFFNEKKASIEIQDTGLYFKFNCSNEIKLVRVMLEDAGFVNIASMNH